MQNTVHAVFCFTKNRTLLYVHNSIMVGIPISHSPLTIPTLFYEFHPYFTILHYNTCFL